MYPPSSLFHRHLLAASCLTALLGLSACQQEGPAEQAGKAIDHSAEKTQESVDQAIKKSDDYLERSTENSKNTLENAGKKLDQAAEHAEHKMESLKDSALDKASDASASVDDAMITVAVKSVLVSDLVLKASHIDVSTTNRVVTLSGTVDSEQSLGRALELAGSQKQVSSVLSTLQVIAPRGQ